MKQQGLLNIALTPLVICIGLFYSLFVQGHNSSFRWLPITVLLFLVLVALNLIKSYKQKLSLPINAISITYTLLFMWQLCSILWSPVPSDSFLFVLTSLLLPLALYAGFQLYNKQKYLLQQNLQLLILIVVAYTCYQAFILKTYRPSGFFLNGNTNAAFIGMILLPLCSQFLIKPRFTSGGIAILLIFTICISVSRGALLSISLGLILIYAASWQYVGFRPNLKKLSICLVSGFIMSHLALGLTVQQPTVSKKIYHSLKTTTQTFNKSSNIVKQRDKIVSKPILQTKNTNLLFKISPGRYYLWESAWRMYLERPILGWGYGLYHWLQPRFRAAEFSEIGQLVHNDYLQFLLELGPIGLILLLSFVLAVFIKIWQIYRDTPQLENRLINLGYGSACMVLLIHSGLTFHLYQAPMLIMLGLYLGLLSQNLSQIQIKPIKQTRSYLFYSIISSFSLFSVIALGYLFSSFNALPKQEKALYTHQTFLKLSRAIQRTPFIEELQALQSTILVDFILKGASDQSQQEYKKVINFALMTTKQATKKNPLRASNHYNRARLLSIQTENQKISEQVHQAYQQALLHNPYYLEARINYALELFKHNEIEQGKKILKQGLGYFYAEKYQMAIRFLALLTKYSTDNREKKHYQNKSKQLNNEIKRTKRIGGIFTL